MRAERLLRATGSRIHIIRSWETRAVLLKDC